jgi:hypothetical protein
MKVFAGFVPRLVKEPDRTGPRELRIHADEPLATYRSLCAAILLTRTVAETV